MLTLTNAGHKKSEKQLYSVPNASLAQLTLFQAPTRTHEIRVWSVLHLVLKNGINMMRFVLTAIMIIQHNSDTLVIVWLTQWKIVVRLVYRLQKS